MELLTEKEEDTIENESRCVTPSSLIRTTSNDDEDDNNSYDSEIPHMLNPYSDQSDDEGNNYCHDNEVLVEDDPFVHPIKVSPTGAQAPDSLEQYWHVSTGSYDVVNTSPVSSISNFSFDHVNAMGLGENRNDIIGGSVGDVNVGYRKDFMSLLSNTSTNKHKTDELTSPNLVRERHVPRTTLKPRYGKLDHTTGNQNHNNMLYPNDSTPLTKIGRAPSPAVETDSQGSNNASNRNRGNRGVGPTYRSFTGSDFLLPGSPRSRRKINNHRRSASLNQVPSSLNSHRRSNSRINELRLSPLREEMHSPISKQNHKLPTPSHLAHRRTVSFPDQVLQKAGFYSINRSMSAQSDDPALFSLVETTQSKSNGRVCIPLDVDPCISNNISLPVIPHVTHSNLYLTSDQLMQPHPGKKLVVDGRNHHPRRHMHRKGSGSGSFSSLELKLTSLEEENVELDDGGEHNQQLRNDRREQMKDTRHTPVRKNRHQKQQQYQNVQQTYINTNAGADSANRRGEKRSFKKRKDLKLKEKIQRKSNRKITETQTLHVSKGTFDTDEGLMAGKVRRSKETCVIM